MFFNRCCVYLLTTFKRDVYKTNDGFNMWSVLCDAGPLVVCLFIDKWEDRYHFHLFSCRLLVVGYHSIIKRSTQIVLFQTEYGVRVTRLLLTCTEPTCSIEQPDLWLSGNISMQWPNGLTYRLTEWWPVFGHFFTFLLSLCNRLNFSICSIWEMWNQPVGIQQRMWLFLLHKHRQYSIFIAFYNLSNP